MSDSHVWLSNKRQFFTPFLPFWLLVKDRREKLSLFTISSLRDHGDVDIEGDTRLKMHFSVSLYRRVFFSGQARAQSSAVNYLTGKRPVGKNLRNNINTDTILQLLA